jgi:DNA-binding CsgD family transcriptional regulator
MLKQALTAFRRDDSTQEGGVRWLALACRVAMDLWDDESWEALSTRQVQLARDAGALAVLFIALRSRIGLHLYAGELAAAASLIEEAAAVAEATGTRFAPYEVLALAAWRGREADASELIRAGTTEVVARGEGMGLAIIRWTSAVLYNGLGRYDEALTAAQEASAYPQELLFSTWGLVELIEASVHMGKPELATEALRRLSDKARASGTDWALGFEACSRAMLDDTEAAERLYREAIERLGRTRIRVAVARAHLVYGEWLRRQKRRLDAREQLRTAHEMLTEMGIEGFADRAERELLATGETARKRILPSSHQLTPREAQIAGLARDGLANPEIGARLFISARTVEYHLHKVFAKLGISSRSQLGGVLSDEMPAGQLV